MGTREGILTPPEYLEKVSRLEKLINEKNQKEAELVVYLRSGNVNNEKLEELLGEMRSNEMFIDQLIAEISDYIREHV